MLKSPNVSVLLSTFNGSAFLSEQLKSVENQSYKDWHLLVRDDGSRDETPEILRQFKDAHPEKVTIIDNCPGNVGPSRSFGLLLGAANASYVMFCDQDDIWLPDKIELTMGHMTELEAIFGINTPVLVHTDLQLIDEKRSCIAASFWEYGRFKPDPELNRLLMKNCVTGNTVMINKAMQDSAVPFPDEIAMYDWWLALIARLIGKIGYLKKQTIQYRQHGGNAVGAGRWQMRCTLKRPGSRLRSYLAIRSVQAAMLLERFKGCINDHDRELLDNASHLASSDYFLSRYLMLKYRLFTYDSAKNIFYFLFA